MIGQDSPKCLEDHVRFLQYCLDLPSTVIRLNVRNNRLVGTQILMLNYLNPHKQLAYLPTLSYQDCVLIHLTSPGTKNTIERQWGTKVVKITRYSKFEI